MTCVFTVHRFEKPNHTASSLFPPIIKLIALELLSAFLFCIKYVSAKKRPNLCSTQSY